MRLCARKYVQIIMILYYANAYYTSSKNLADALNLFLVDLYAKS